MVGHRASPLLTTHRSTRKGGSTELPGLWRRCNYLHLVERDPTASPQTHKHARGDSKLPPAHCPSRSPPVPKGLPRRDAERGVLPDPQDAAVGLIVAEGSIGEVLRVGGHFVQQVHFICMGKRHNQQLSCLRGGALLVALPRRWATAEPPTGCSVLSQASLLKFAHYQQKKWHKGRGMKPLHPSRGGCGTPPRPKQGTAARCELHGEPCITQFPFPSR